jgi:hypothetical protein
VEDTTVGSLTVPHVSSINERESLPFFSSDSAPFPCALCDRDRPDLPVVRSGGLRIDVFYMRGDPVARGDATLVSDPICWSCVRGRARGAEASHDQWRAAAARFLNDLHASDPESYYCGIQGLG